MKIGANTLIWGNRLDNVARVLDFLALHGCEGVEISQRPEQLGDPGEVRELLAHHGLVLLGLSGGTIEDRIKYCGKILKPRYLYVDAWDEAEALAASSAGIPLALHPHIFRPVRRLADAETELREHPDLQFLPDVAHLTIAGDSPAHAVAEWRERLAAIHIKDWTPAYGRSTHRYARGFVELGKGIVNFDQLFERLLSIRYEGWLIFEQGSRDASPEQIVAQATQWLGQRAHKLLNKRAIPIRGTATAIQQPKSALNVFPDSGPVVRQSYSLEEERDFFETLFRITSEGPRRVYPRLAEAVGKLLKASVVMLCSHIPAANLMSVIGLYPANLSLGKLFLEYKGSLSGVALERQAVTVFDLTSPEPGATFGQPTARFGYPDLITRMNLKELISVPVLDPQNPHQARFVVNIFSFNSASSI